MKANELQKWLPQNRNIWLSLGNFDGVHIAHQKLLKDTVLNAEKYNCIPGVLLLEPHPEIKFFNKKNFLLTTMEEKVQKISEIGVELGILKVFDNEFAKITPQKFVSWLKHDLQVKGVSVGFDYSFGYRGLGSSSDLKYFGESCGLEVSIIESIKVENNTVVSSNLCRTYIEEGKIEKANKMLSSPYSIRGQVMKGDGRGRNLGFPTANIEIPVEKVIPKKGVYLVRVNFEDATSWGICNVGNKPTFDGKNVVAETYIFDCQRDLYNLEIEVEFFNFIREEKKFHSAQSLTHQLNKDLNYARSLLS
ncbi:bifunctional riboflavin kinase/FAD synthetase [Natranaerobius trueperi]|nr:bifunctional riboflavin kinase/FAD synthetase [Natranaerobius trueperi]